MRAGRGRAHPSQRVRTLNAGTGGVSATKYAPKIYSSRVPSRRSGPREVGAVAAVRRGLYQRLSERIAV